MVSGHIILDAGPLGLASHPGSSSVSRVYQQWQTAMILAGWTFAIPEIADYEVRRELLRASKSAGIASLDRLIRVFIYLPLTTDAMRKAAELWATARATGRPAAADPALDADMILAAQALTLDAKNAVIATTNPKHLSPFVRAAEWRTLAP